MVVRIGINNIDAFHTELSAKEYKYNRPGVETMPWGLREMTVHDPNRLRFFAPAA